MATLRYIAFLAQDPARLVDFYHRFLGHRRVRPIAGRRYFHYGRILQFDVFEQRPALGEMKMDLGLTTSAWK